MGFLSSILQDIRIAIRTLAKNPGFAFSATAVLAIGIGATTVMFSVVYSLMLEPFVYKDSQRLITFNITDLRKNGFQRPWFYIPEFLAIREQNRSLEDLVGYRRAEVTYETNANTRNILGGWVTVNSFNFLGVQPLLGRGIEPSDGEAGAAPVFVMNYGMWKRDFGADPKILGKSFVLDHRLRTLVGIMPRRFQFVPEAEVWLPLSLKPGAEGQLNVARLPIGLIPVGRLRPGADLESAKADLNVIFGRLAKIPVQLPYLPHPVHFAVGVESLRSYVTKNFRSTLFALLAAVGVLLLIACSNVSSLLLVQATRRRREIAIRSAIGASRGRLVQQLLVESSVICFAACTLGCVLAYLALNIVRGVLPSDAIPPETPVRFHPVVLLFSIGLASLTTFLCGLAPAVYAVRGDVQTHLAAANRSTDGGYGSGKLRAGLVILEVALSVVLLAGAGLMARTMIALARVDIGVEPTRLLYAQITLPKDKYSAAQKRIFYHQVIDRLDGLPGIMASGTGPVPTVLGAYPNLRVRGNASGELKNGTWALVDPGYFRALDVQLIRGRWLSEDDMDSRRLVTIVNETLAKQYFGSGDPIGREIQVDSFKLLTDVPKDAYFEIVGVVSDFNNTGLREAVAPEVFIPYTFTGAGDRTLLARTSGNPNAVLKSVVQAISEIDPAASVGDTGTLAQVVDAENSYTQFQSEIIGVFAVLGTVLVAFGIFSVMAYTVSLQTRSFGIRVALGAKRGHIIQRVLNRAFALVWVGIVLGVCAAFGFTRLMASYVWGISTKDPVTFSAVPVLMLVIGLLGSLLPARRASQVDPAVVLRQE